MKQVPLILAILFSVLNASAQEYKFREHIDKDSLFNASIKDLPEETRAEFIKMYKEGNEEAKEFLLFMISMPKSSKQELIANYENNKPEILKLKEQYLTFVPKNYIVDIEFEPESKILTVGEEISIKVYTTNGNQGKSDGNNAVRRNDNLSVVSQNWHLKPGSKELAAVLKSIGWTDQTLIKIKKLLKSANCISIENGNITTVGFARSGMGKYSYKIFEKALTQEQRTAYNNGCEYIYYKDNIVLQYGGGAVGPQCFERE